MSRKYSTRGKCVMSSAGLSINFEVYIPNLKVGSSPCLEHHEPPNASGGMPPPPPLPLLQNISEFSCLESSFQQFPVISLGLNNIQAHFIYHVKLCLTKSQWSQSENLFNVLLHCKCMYLCSG